MTINLFGRQINARNEIIAVLLTILVFLAGITGYLINKGGTDIIIESQSEEKAVSIENTAETTIAADSSEDGKDAELDEEAEEIKIYVVGCVKKQGIVTLKKGQLIDDAIRLAGGVTEDADLASINLVYRLDENLMLYIKSKKELVQASKSGGESERAGNGARLVKDSGGAVVNVQGSSSVANNKVNINTATISELDTLPGIGEATAADIISYRENNGLFKTIQDIMKVPRIKESRFASIKDFITVE